MVTIDVSQAVGSLNRLTRGLTRSEVDGAIVKALNRAIDTGYTFGGRKVRERYNITASSISQRTVKIRARRGGATLSASLRANTRVVSLKQFGARQTRKGVTVEVLRGSRKLIKSAFIKQMPNGVTGVMARGKYQSSGGVDVMKFRQKRINKTGNDLPIESLKAVSVYALMATDNVRVPMENEAVQMYTGRLSHEIGQLVSRVFP